MKAGKQARVMSMAVLALLVSGMFVVQDVQAARPGRPVHPPGLPARRRRARAFRVRELHRQAASPEAVRRRPRCPHSLARHDRPARPRPIRLRARARPRARVRPTRLPGKAPGWRARNSAGDGVVESGQRQSTSSANQAQRQQARTRMSKRARPGRRRGSRRDLRLIRRAIVRRQPATIRPAAGLLLRQRR
jgi:hypothetical protein